MRVLTFSNSISLKPFITSCKIPSSITAATVTGLRLQRRVLTTTNKKVLPPSAMFTFIRDIMVGTSELNPLSKPVNSGKNQNVVLSTPVLPPDGEWKQPLQQATLGLGCFWGAEKKFWQAPGVYTTSVGYAGGDTKNPSYKSVCSGRTNHAEVVNVVFDSTKTSYEKILDIFWDTHDPTTKNRQGNDVGTQYRSVVFYYNDEQKKLAQQSLEHYNNILKAEGRNACTTEISPAPEYYLAEDYHQQYLHKNPWGYCGLGGTGLYRPRDQQ